MTETAITPAATPLCELPAEALRVAAAFAGFDEGFDHVAIRPAGDGQVVVTGGSNVMAAEVVCEGQATAEVALPIRPLRVALRRLPARHASVVLAAEQRLATLRLYSEDSTLAVSMPLGAESGVRLPAIEPGAQVSQLAISGAVLAAASARLAGFGVVSVETIPNGWLLSGESDGLRLRALVAGVRRE